MDCDVELYEVIFGLTREAPKPENGACQTLSKRRRCDAFVKALYEVSQCGARRAKNPKCRAWAMTGKTRCRMHGGASTGPRTAEGKARVIAAMVDGSNPPAAAA